MEPTIVPRVARVGGRLHVPGDKSISHRYALLAAIADGTSRLTGYAPGADCLATLACLEALGARVTRAGTTVTIDGLGLGGLRAPTGPIDAANSGTSMRLLAGVLAAHPFKTVIVGDASLSRRPMRRVIEPLTRMGAVIAAADGRPPLTIDGAALHGIAHEPEVPSAQVKSAVLLAGLHARGRTTVVEQVPTGIIRSGPCTRSESRSTAPPARSPSTVATAFARSTPPFLATSRPRCSGPCSPPAPPGPTCSSTGSA